MLRDVFYYGNKPNVHPREKFAKDLNDARRQSTTEHFWIINEFCDYKNFDWDFDFDFLPDEDVWASEHNNVWPSVYQKDSGTWLCPKIFSDIIVYRNDVDSLKRKNIKNDNWVIHYKIDESRFDFAWHPDPTEPPYNYIWGSQWVPATFRPTVEYKVPGATSNKYMTGNAFVVPDMSKWEFLEEIDIDSFDFSWEPDPTSPPYIYAWGNQWNNVEDKISIIYKVEGATDYKYMLEKTKRKSNLKNWLIPNDINASEFDFSWEPNPNDPPYIYQFGTQHQKTGGPRYIVEGATEIKYIDDVKAIRLSNTTNWKTLYNYNIEHFDYSWHPDTTEDPYIYVFGNQWHDSQTMPTIEYHVAGATQRKYVDTIKAKLGPDKTFWLVPENIDISDFDFSWKPNPFDPPYIYKFGTQWQKTGGPEYWTPGATESKYIDILKAKALPTRKNWYIPPNIDVSGFDFSWHPDTTEDNYKYKFGTQWQKTGGPIYLTDDSSPVKYIDNPKARSLPDRSNWIIPADVDPNAFDFSWHPDSDEGLFVYQFGTQHQKTGGPKYLTPGTMAGSPIKYVDTTIIKSKRMPKKSRFTVLNDLIIEDFDYSWHPDDTDKPYIYIFGNNQYPAEKMPTLEYVVSGAKEVKYSNHIFAKLGKDLRNWEIPNDVDVTDFDFSWKPDPQDPPYIYQFGTQHQKTGGPKYVVPDAIEIKYIDTQKAKKLENKKNFKILNDYLIEDFDYSWHHDESSEPYIYVFGNQHHSAEVMPTIEYRVEGAVKVKYINEISAKLAQEKTKWYIPNNIDDSAFDYSWKPMPGDDIPYIYEFGTQWQKTGGPMYVSEGIQKLPNGKPIGPRKYMDFQKVKKLPELEKFTILNNYKIANFDYSWHPDDTESGYIYVFGNQYYNAERMPTIHYGNGFKNNYKYVNDLVATLASDKTNWEIPKNIDDSEFDYSWVPDPGSPPYIYQFGTQWQKTDGPRYIVEGATEVKFIEGSKAKRLPDKSKFTILINNKIENFDYSWHPDSTEEPYIYVFGNQHHDCKQMPTLKYTVPGATQTKYVDDVKAVLKSDKTNFKILIPIDENKFDFSWIPDPNDPPYTYVFGNQWNESEIEPTVEYHMMGANNKKYVHNIKAIVLPDSKKWKKLTLISNFDYSWRPNPKDPPYIYVFGNQWFNAEKDPTLEYVVEGATDKKYINDIKAIVAADMSNWEIPKGINVKNFDFSWRPDPGSPPYIYQFGTLSDDNDGPRYIHPKNTGEIVRLLRVEKEVIEQEIEVSKYYIETTLEDLVNNHKNEIFWALRKEIVYDNFDFEWRPNIEQARYVHVFGSPEAEITQTYFVSGPMYIEGHKDFNFVEQDKKANEEYLAELFIQPDIFLVDRGNPETQDRFEQLKSRFTNVQKTRFLNSWVDTINRCINRSNTELCWILNSELDYSNFDFKYYPNPWQMNMVHVFGTQWSHWGTTFMVNRETFAEDTKYVKIIEHLQNLNFVKDRKAFATNNLYDIVVIDHGNKECTDIVEKLKTKAAGKNVSTVSYDTSYLQTIKNIVDKQNNKKENYLWICSSICDYNNFAFTYICDPFAKDNLHVFPSNNQKFGDTFLLDVNKTKEIINDLIDLKDYNKVNYNQHQKAKRLPHPVIAVDEDTHTNIVTYDFDFPYAQFKSEEIADIDVEPMCLWTEETKNIIVTSTGATNIIAPKEIRNFVEKQLYDYPYIKTSSRLTLSKPLDIVFLSNGEKCAEENYEYLLEVTKGLKNRIVRVDGVNGRVAAYHAAVMASDTPWAFTVFAKLKVNAKFDFNWQPDRLQMPKHYIFHAKNPINGLEYGHQGMIAYNKRLTLANTGKGLDFTLDDPHETVQLLSGTANFNTDEYSTWRTAFREVIKLKSDYTDISQERLNIWLTKAKGKYAKNCLQGSNDAVEYYDSVSGDIDQLKLSYEWDWLKEYYNRKYK